jgi:oleate hydratase
MALADHASDGSAPRGKDRDRSTAKVYLVGGGIASLAAATFMIRDGDVPGHNISILEELDKLCGSLDSSGSSQNGYVLRGGRMLESKYLCTYELLSSLYTIDAGLMVT